MRIKAEVSTRILKKADSFFTGSTKGRITEIMQNCRRSRASQVVIEQRCPAKDEVNDEIEISVEDNGHGIADWAKILHLGESGWRADIEESEDPAGVGLFSIAPRALTIQSGGRVMVVEGDAWYGGSEIEIRDDTSKDRVTTGTRLRFRDKYWGRTDVLDQVVQTIDGEGQGLPHKELCRAGAFGSMTIRFNAYAIPQADFTIEGVESVAVPELGIRIQVVRRDRISPNRQSFGKEKVSIAPVHRSIWGSSVPSIVLNFYGQLIGVNTKRSYYHHSDAGIEIELPSDGIYYNSTDQYCVLIDMVGDTPLQLMLPARTRLVENDAIPKLIEVIQRQALRYVTRHKDHQLDWHWYQRALELGLEISESKPVYYDGTQPSDDRGMMNYPQVWYGSHQDRASLLRSVLLDADCGVVVHDGEDGEVYRSFAIPDDADDEGAEPELKPTISDVDEFLSIVGQTIHDNAEDFDIVSIPAGYREYSWAQLDTITFIEFRLKTWIDNFSPWYGSIKVYEEITAHIEFKSGRFETVEIPVCLVDSADAGGCDVAVTRDALSDVADLILYCHGGYSDDGEESTTEQDRNWEEEMQAILDELHGPRENKRRKLTAAVEEHVVTPAVVAFFRNGDVAIRGFRGQPEIIRQDGTFSTITGSDATELIHSALREAADD